MNPKLSKEGYEKVTGYAQKSKSNKRDGSLPDKDNQSVKHTIQETPKDVKHNIHLEDNHKPLSDKMFRYDKEEDECLRNKNRFGNVYEILGKKNAILESDLKTSLKRIIDRINEELELTPQSEMVEINRKIKNKAKEIIKQEMGDLI